MANLIIWRHAEAEVNSNSGMDADRALTKKGQKDAAKMAKWLIKHLPENTEILCSPAKRCQETAKALEALNTTKTLIKIKTVDFLGINNSIETIAKEVLNEDTSRTLLLVGHQPNLGHLISKVLGMNERACVVKKGAVWWLRQRYTFNDLRAKTQTYLFLVLHPDY